MGLHQVLDWADALQINKARVQEKWGRKKLSVVWMNVQDCTGCSESLLRVERIAPSVLLQDVINLEYSELLSYSHRDINEFINEKFVLVVEGSFATKEECAIVGGESVFTKVKKLTDAASYIIAVGSCSSYGGIPAAKPNPTEAVSLEEIVDNKTILKLPGCPPIPEVIAGSLLYIWAMEELPNLDRKNRPLLFYKRTVHQDCSRKKFFDQKLFAESFDDPHGYCLLKLGCKGPSTFNACESVLWNGRKSSPISSGNICIGCSEKNSWDKIGLPKAKKTVPRKL